MMLADKYRPRRFKDVWGQDVVVKQLSGLARARRGSHLLLTGAYGSGKTTLVRIFARALNCEDLTEDGSPCEQCPSCRASGDCLVEYDVPGRGGDKDAIRAWVDAHNREATTTKWKILFLDEAHALKPAAVDSLLKDVEEPRAGVLFALATTEPWELKPTLKSRTLPLEVRPLSAPDAVDFLESIAKLEGISYDRDALLLLGCVKQGHPRDLLNGLGQVAGLGRGVTVEAVKSLFAVHDAESLIEYFLALGTGDASSQIAAMGRWRERLSSKIQAVQTLLTSIHYNELLGRKIVIDALLDTLSNERARILAAFCSRLGVSVPSELIPYWTVMLDFWSRARSIDEEAAQLQLCLFEDLVNRRLQHEGLEFKLRSLPRKTGARSQLVSTPHSIEPIVDAPAADIALAGPGDQYLGPAHVREVINRASAFVQHHGQALNAAFTIYPSWRARSSEASAIAAIRRFREELSENFSLASAQFASVTTYERELGGVLGRVVAHLPGLVESPAAEDALHAWCESLQSDDGDGLLVRLNACQGVPDARAMRFHWNCVLTLCAVAQDGEGGFGSARRLLDDLRVPRALRRQTGPIRHPVLEFSGALSSAAIEGARASNMEFLSAFDAQAWPWIRKGWERNEYLDRQRELEERTRKLSDIKRLWSDADKRRIEIGKLEASWSQGPESRPRRWRGWWLQ
ncbi:AAA family ATPase [Bradyrhizobium genosp. A]|uniref:AAA family ATPase n=1 Tax=Bradyrhizobium genosp. A TaxID=83626 RepID=UPI003CED76F8